MYISEAHSEPYFDLPWPPLPTRSIFLVQNGLYKKITIGNFFSWRQFSFHVMRQLICICQTLVHGEFSRVSSNCLPPQKVFFLCDISSVSSNCLPWPMQNHIGCIYVVFPYVVFLTNCWMFHKKKRSWWWQVSTVFSPLNLPCFFYDE